MEFDAEDWSVRERVGAVIGRSFPVWLTLLLALACLGGGLLVGNWVRSPAVLAAEAAPPPPGLITAKVEARQLTALVVARADVVPVDSVVVNPSAPEGVEFAVVTGQLPERGEKIAAGDVLVEVGGRPIFALPGSFPAYRALGPGSSGPDVQQLRSALKKLGYSSGESSKDYDAELAATVKKFYEDAGYPPPGAEDLSRNQAVRDAQDALVEAKEARNQAKQDHLELEAALPTGAARPEADARAEKQELTAAKLALNAAGRAVARAAESLAEAQEAAWTTVPSSEVAFISDLPRRVDAANMVVGQIIGAGSADGGTDAGEASDVIVLSGAQVEITAQVPGSQALLVPEGSHATITVVDGAEIAATVATVCAAPDSQEHCELGIRVADEQDVGSDALSGNVRVSITVGTSAPDALIVPLAAVSSKMSGQAQVQLVTNLVKDAPTSDQETSMVAVDVGLSADGYVEVRPVDGTLRPGDLVVVGVETSGAGVAPEGVAGVVTADMPGKASGAVPEDVAENTPEAVLEDAENVAGTVLEDVTGVATGGMADAVGAVLDTQWKPP